MQSSGPFEVSDEVRHGEGVWDRGFRSPKLDQCLGFKGG